ncbi:MAG: ferredoxin [Candidatus Aenigmatarchaeota archaeon]
MFRLSVDKEKCIGCGSCVAVCNNWEIGEDGKAAPINKEVAEVGENKEAEEICPVGAIEIKEKK